MQNDPPVRMGSCRARTALVCSQWAAVHKDAARGAALWEAVDLSDVVGDPRNRRSDELERSRAVSSLRVWLQRRCRPGGSLRQLQLARAPVSDGYPGAHLPLVRGLPCAPHWMCAQQIRSGGACYRCEPVSSCLLHNCHTQGLQAPGHWHHEVCSSSTHLHSSHVALYETMPVKQYGLHHPHDCAKMFL